MACGVLPMKSVMLRFLFVFIPTCAIGIGAGFIGIHSRGLWSAMGWLAAGIVGLFAIFQLIALISGLIRVISWQATAQERLKEIEKRDAELFASGKSFEEVISQYKRPEP
jgi:hypothetical protein